MPETSGVVRLYHHIGGEQVTPASGEWFDSHNPTNRETLYAAARGDARDVDRAVAAARRTFEHPAGGT
jgi:acyl-CoA reductase-like NAD-dependent aldehyde dehydrogenase